MKNQLFDFSVNVLQALLWQYNEADALTAILQAKQSWYDANHTQFWEDWIVNVFDVRTANDFGCAVWAIILGIPLSVVQSGSSDTWGFGTFHKNFTRGNFLPAAQTTIPLTLDQKRIVLQLRYYQLITRGCIPSINRFMKRLFADLGPVYVVNSGPMAMTYHFGFVIPSSLQFIFRFYSLLPAPTGVAVDFVGL
jgi:Protein of unknown function (DUF2612)